MNLPTNGQFPHVSFVDLLISQATLGSGWPRGCAARGVDERHDALRFLGAERERGLAVRGHVATSSI